MSQAATRSEPPGPADAALLAGYASWPAKGPDCGGVRLTIRADRTEVRAGEEVRVLHVVEALDSRSMYVMGPKEVIGEVVDGGPGTLPYTDDGDDPLVPLEYDGRVIDGPGVDTNYMITVYSFEAPGEHSIIWRPGPYGSNELRIAVQ